jgi:hypothetical protein
MQHSITLPYRRTSPVHVPRSDLVLSAADSLLLTVVVVESDHPSAQAIVLHTDANGPAMQLVLWDDAEYRQGWGDYGWGWGGYTSAASPGALLQSLPGYPGSAAGSWDFHIPTGTFAHFPRRCGWAILLLWNQGAKSSVLGQGIASFLRPYFTGTPLTAIPPDPGIPITPPGAPAHLGLTTDNLFPIVMSNDITRQLETS